jgi:hypothetical protein
LSGHPFEKKTGYSLAKKVRTTEITVECSQKGFTEASGSFRCADVRLKERTKSTTFAL